MKSVVSMAWEEMNLDEWRDIYKERRNFLLLHPPQPKKTKKNQSAILTVGNSLQILFYWKLPNFILRKLPQWLVFSHWEVFYWKKIYNSPPLPPIQQL